MRIGRELHDNVGSQLAYVASSLSHSTGPHAPSPAELAELVTQAIRDLRNTVWLIHHETCTVEELVVRLRETLRSIPGVTILPEFTGAGKTLLGAQMNTHVLRILQEGVSNALKHSEATRIRINIDDHTAGQLSVTIEDNGKGFDPQQHTEGFGLRNMADRLSDLNGTMKIESVPGAGCRILLTLPV